MDTAVHRRLAVLQQHFDLHLRLPQQDASQAGGVRFDVRALQELLDHDNLGMRAAVKEFMKDELYLP